jgi:hypothetical protein
MATGFPFSTGDVLLASEMNGLVAFTLNAQSGTTYTLASTDQYQVLVVTSNASAKTVSIPTDATYAFPNGTCISFLNTGAGDLTIDAVTPGTTTITSAGATSAAPVVEQFKSAAAIKTGTDAWTIVGAVS